MMLTEVSAVPDAALPLAALREQVRLGSGFADDGAQDGLLLRCLRAAIGAIEARTGKALLAREFRLRRAGWRCAAGEPLPVAPVRGVAEVALLDREGNVTVVAPERWRLEADLHAPRLVPVGGALPLAPAGGAVEVRFEAGLAQDWSGLPPDLGQAVLLLAAQYHALRGEAGPGEGALPFGVMALVERWRVLRAGFGGAA